MAEVKEAHEELRKPFPAEAIGKLPRVTCKDCSNPKVKCAKADGDHRSRRCDVCKAYVSPAHIHIDFVGHALVTDRLLSVDPAWSWEPMGWTAEGTPAIGRSVNERDAVLWIRLTVDGKTKPGVGSVALDSHEAEKQLIGDAIRNAAMRFGVALQLWAKAELESALVHDETEAPRAEPKEQAPRQNTSHGRQTDLSVFAKAVLMAAERAKVPDELLASFIEEATGSPRPASITRDAAPQITDLIYQWEKSQEKVA